MLLELHRKEYPDFLSGKDARQTTEKWALDIERLIRIDKKEPETIKQVIEFVKTPGNFWFSNIESGKKLREKYDRLVVQMTQVKHGTTSPPRHKIASDELKGDDWKKYFKGVT